MDDCPETAGRFPVASQITCQMRKSWTLLRIEPRRAFSLGSGFISAHVLTNGPGRFMGNVSATGGFLITSDGRETNVRRRLADTLLRAETLGRRRIRQLRPDKRIIPNERGGPRGNKGSVRDAYGDKRHARFCKQNVRLSERHRGILRMAEN